MTYLLVDGHNLLHRAFHVAVATRRAFGHLDALIFLKSLRTTFTLYPTVRRAVVVWDAGVSARRRAMLPTYRLRHHDPTVRRALGGVQATLTQALDALRVPQVRIEPHEADDLIAHLARTAPGPVLIQSDDKDFYQLITESCHVWRPMAEGRAAGSGLLTPETFQAQWGFAPAYWLYYRACIGDGSDKIDGIPQIGPKTALRVIQTMTAPTPQAAHAALATLGHGQHWAQFAQNLDLMALDREPLDQAPTWSTGVLIPLVLSEVAHVFGLFEFKSLLQDLDTWVQPFHRLTRPISRRVSVRPA